MIDNHPTFFQRFGKQILMSICASIIAGMFLNATGILKAVRWFSKAVIITTGDPTKDRDGGVFPLHLPKSEGKPILGVPHIPAKGEINIGPRPRTSEEIAADERAKEEGRKRQEQERTRRDESERKSIVAQLEIMGWPFDKEGSLEKLRAELKAAKDMDHKKPLLVRAVKLGIKVDPKDPYDVIEDEVKEAELDWDYHQQEIQYEENCKLREWAIKVDPNARCLNPRCKFRWRTNHTKGQAFCPRCRAIWFVSQVKANAPPPPPMPPMPVRKQQKDGIIARVKEGVFGK